MVWLHVLHPPPPPVSKLDRRHTGRRKERQFGDCREERGRAWSLIIRPQESLVLYKSFNHLCPRTMGQIAIETPTLIYWCLIEFIDWRYSQSCWNFRPALSNSALLTFSPVSSLPLPCVNKYTVLYIRIQCVRGGGESMGS
jgi:hypothetical protein